MTKKLSKFEKLTKKLKTRHKKIKSDFGKKQVKAVKWLAAKNLSLGDLYHSTSRLLTTGTLAGTLLLSSGNIPTPNLTPGIIRQQSLRAQLSEKEYHKQLAKHLLNLLPSDIGKIQGDNANKICDVLDQFLDFKVCFNLDGNELNYAYAWTGYEQHLYRYPGDTLEQHDDELQAGIAPGLGAWGYFADSKDKMTQEDYLREKYYVAVQTLYLPEWFTDWQKIYDWYKYRKVVMVNPENGQACVAVVGDAGPASWTGKQFGGSPEVMKTLGLSEGWRKGKVLLLFVDDKEDKIPLGPVQTYGTKIAQAK
jgi:hypothetical protein